MKRRCFKFLGAFLFLLFFPSCTIAQTIKIATFNIEQFTDNTPKDLQTIANIVRRYDLVAVQEVKKTGKAVRDLIEALGGQWDYLLGEITGNHERFAYIFNKDKVKFMNRMGALHFKDNRQVNIDRVPLFACFASGNFDFCLVTVHLFYTDDLRREAEIIQLIQWYKEHQKKDPEKDLIILGDFNEKKKKPLFGHFKDSRFRVITEELFSNLGDTERYDHLILSRDTAHEFEGTAGVYKFDEVLFGNDDTLAEGKVSDHRPVFGVFWTNKEDDD